MQDLDNATALEIADKKLLAALDEIAKAEPLRIQDLNARIDDLIAKRLDQIHNLRQARNEYGTRLAIIERFGK